MNRGMFFLVGIILILLGIEIFCDVNTFIILGISIFIWVTYFITFFAYLSKRKPNIIRNLKNKYTLEVLDNTEDDIYVIKKYCDISRYIFSYVNEDGKKVTCLESSIEIENVDEKPYVEIYSKEYKTKGFLDFIYFPIYMEKYDIVYYVLHVNDNMIKSDN